MADDEHVNTAGDCLNATLRETENGRTDLRLQVVRVDTIQLVVDDESSIFSALELELLLAQAECGTEAKREGRDLTSSHGYCEVDKGRCMVERLAVDSKCDLG